MSLDEYPIDKDYIDVEEQQASLLQTGEYKHDGAYKYNRDDDGLAATAIDVEIDRREVSDRDERGGTRTGFNAKEANGYLSESIHRDGQQRTRAEWLRLLQNGYRDISLSRTAQNSEANRHHIVDTFSSRLDLSNYQHDRVKLITDDVGMNEMAHYPVELVVLAAISIVTNEDDRWIREEELFKQMVMDVDGSMQGIKKSRQLLKEKSDIIS